jgi:hypothetical protein
MRSYLSFSVALAVLALPSSAFAARLLLPEEVPAAASAATASPPSATVAAERHDPPSFGVHFAVAAGVGVVSAPLSLLLANALGNLSISLIPTAILGLVPMGLVAPVLTALAGWLFGNRTLTDADGRFSFWAGAGAAFVVHVVALVIAGFAGVSLTGIPGLLLFSLLDGAAMGGASVGAMRFFRKTPQPVAVLELPSFTPTVSATSVVPLSTIPF